MWDYVSTGQGHQNYDALSKHGRKNNYILIQSSLCHVYVHYEDTRLREITLLPMPWSDVVWRWLLCRQLDMMCILQELATKISVQVTSVRRWDWSNTVQNAYGTVSLHGAIVKITENRVIVSSQAHLPPSSQAGNKTSGCRNRVRNLDKQVTLLSRRKKQLCYKNTNINVINKHMFH